MSSTWCFGASGLEKDKREHEKDIQKIFHNESLKVEEGGFPFLQLYQILLLKQVDACNSYSGLGRSINALSCMPMSNLNATIQLFTSTQLLASLNRYKYIGLEELIFQF